MTRPTLHRDRRGFIAVTYALMIFGLLAFAGLAVDVGYIQWCKRRAQMAADAAAMGGLRELEVQRTGFITMAGKNDAALNGFTDGQNNTTVTINTPPLYGVHAGSSYAVEAIVRRNVPTYFMMLFGRNNVPIAARAVGHTTIQSGSIGGCIFALNKTIKGGFSVNGTSISLRTDCSTIVNSEHNEAFIMGSGVIYRLYKGAHVGVKGNWNFNGQAQLIDMTRNLPNGMPVSPNHNGQFDDPLANVTEPTQSNLPIKTMFPHGGDFDKNNMPPNNTIPPGIYCGGIRVGDTNGVALQMNGVYVMGGGGLTINSDARITGTNVTIYNTEGGAGWGCGGEAFAPLTINGNATVNLTAPTSGTFVGMLFFQDRSINDSRDNKINGTSTSTFTGALYFKRSPLSFAGSNATNGYMVLVADTISVNGTTTLGNNYSSLSNPNTFAPFSTGGGLAE